MLCLYKYWFCFEHGQEKVSAGFFRRMQIQNEKDKMTKFIEAELKSESESELKSDIELEFKPDTE